MRIQVGNKIRYSSAAGVLTATVHRIDLDLNAADQTIPWMTLHEVCVEKTMERLSSVRLCASNDYLKQMKVEVL